jgi:uncharacterized repeat protein (TIGR02543 family)
MPRRPRALSIFGMGSTISESVYLTYADSLQQQNITGDTVRVAVVDLGFYGLGKAINTVHELPSNTVIIDLPGSNDNPIDSITLTPHGVAVAEEVMDMAPGATLYCIMVSDEVDMQNAVDTIRARKIQIVNHSVGWPSFGYYDDTGPIDSLVNVSHDQDGVFWTVAGGNEAQRHWRGKWSASGDGLLQFKNGVESMPITGIPESNVIEVDLTWNEFNNPQTDLDLYIYDKSNNLIDSSTYRQPPYVSAESVQFPYSSSQAPYQIKVKKHSAAVPSDTLDITLFSPDADLQYPTSGSSMMDPADAHGACAVASVSINNWTLPTPAVEPFSSRGPTNDGRMKPDIAAPDSTHTWTYGSQGIRGTSYSSPVVAGAAALLKQKYHTITATALADSLRAMAKDVGAAGTDTVFGAGLLYVYLPPPVLVSPSNNAGGLATSQTLTWSTVGNASNYHVQVSTNTSFTAIVNQDSTLTAGSKSISGLTNGTTYYWRVRSKNAHGVSSWSGYWSFTIIKQFALSITATNGTVTKSPSTSPYDSGTVVTLTPVPSAGYVFSSWSGDLTGSSNPGSITMNAAKNITANFTIKQFALSITATNGTVTKSPSTSPYDSGTVVMLTPVPSAGYVFSSWSGDLTGSGNPGSITMNAAKNITANFTIKQFALSITATNGTVTKSPSAGSYDSGTVVTLTPVPSAGYVFSSWSGDLTGSGNPGSITMNAAKNITANFSNKQYTLSVNAINGSVAKSPDQAAYDSGTEVTLTPVPSTGYHFTAWSGDLTGSSNPVTITMTGAKNITAGFAINSYSVTVSSGSGGTVKPAGAQSVNYGDTLKDTATANPGYSFVNWTVTGGVTMAVGGAVGKFGVTGTGTVQANFAIKQYTLTITASNGGVTKAPDQTAYDSGTVVTLTPVPSTGFHFTSWSGDLTGTSNPASLTMNGVKNVAAGFVTNVPDSPVLVSPPNNSVNVDASPVLAWNAVSRASTYQAQVSTTALFADTVINDTGLTVLTKTEGPLLNNTTYYWRVNAKNAGGVGAWSVVWRFVTLPPVPSQVRLVSPKDTAKIPFDSTVFVWGKSSPAVDRYMLEIARDSLLTNKIYSDTAIVDTEKTYKGLTDKTTYWWHARAHNSAGWGSFSALNRLTVAIPSTAVIPKSFSFAMNGMWNSRSSISYALPAETRVSIRLYDIQGRLIATLCDSYEPAGYYHVPVSRVTLSNGYYLLDFRAGEHVIKKKLPLFR